VVGSLAGGGTVSRDAGTVSRSAGTPAALRADGLRADGLRADGLRAAPAPWLRRLDQLGIGLSGLCAVHCAATPLLLLLLPLSGVHEIEEGLKLVLGSLGLVAIGIGMSHHRRLDVAMWLAAALTLLVVATVCRFSLGPHVALSILASAALIRAHWLNARACQHRHLSPNRLVA
jgi:hypothetical protein